MKATVFSILAVFLLLLNNAVHAQPYGATLCANNPNYECYTVQRGDSWQNLFDNPEQRDLVMRVNRMNTHLYRGMHIAIPKDLEDTNLLDWSPMAEQINPPGEKIIIVSLSKLAFGAYNADGILEHWGPVSGARGYCPDIHRGCHTPTGTFAIFSKGGEDCVSTKFPVGRGGAPMPYCMYFHGGFALHGSHEVPGYNASHGCVRMFVDDAEWLNHEFTADERQVAVVIHY